MGKETEDTMPDVEQPIQKLGLNEFEAKILRQAARFKRMNPEQQYAYLEPEFDIADRIQNEARVGRFVDREKLKAIDFSQIPKSTEDREYGDKEYTKAAENARKYYLKNIEKHGDDGIAHLCIPHSVLRYLIGTSGYYRHIPTISALEEHIKEFGERREETIVRPFARHLIDKGRKLYIQKVFQQYDAWTQLPQS